MSHIKEPAGVDFIVDSTPLTAEDRKKISEIIAYYKATGEKIHFQKSKTQPRKQKKRKPLTKVRKRVGVHLVN